MHPNRPVRRFHVSANPTPRAARRGLTTVLLALGVLLAPMADPVSAQPVRRGSPTHTDPGGPALTRSDRRPASVLRAWRGCKPMHTYLADLVVEIQVGWRYGHPVWTGGSGEEGPSGFDGGIPPAPPDFTSTNNQEAGVDELDFVKTDGRALYLTRDAELHIVRAWPPQESALLSSLQLTGRSRGLFLRGDRALVVSSNPSSEIGPGRRAGTRLDLVDVSHPATPMRVRSLEIEGYLIAARKIESRVFAVLSASVRVPSEVWQLWWRRDLGLPEVGRAASEEDRQAAAEVARSILRPLVEASLAPLDILDLLPLLRTRVPGGEWRVEPMVGCQDLYRPAEPTSLAVLAVLSLDLDTFGENGDTESAGVLAQGWKTYASPGSLYIAQSSFWSWWGWGELDFDTTIHRFDLGDFGPRPVRYAATGTVPGFLLNQFSMGEHKGYLRVATTDSGWWTAGEDHQGSRVTVLADDGGGVLRPVGEVTGIAPGEIIFASRFLGDKGYLVTFERIDPLFTLDLSDPTAPRVVGELEIPGFSTYLHPLGDDHLLAVGRAGQLDGTIDGVAVNLFDVGDFAQPLLAFQHVLDEDEGWRGSQALSDHHAFTYHRGVLAIPAYGLSEENGYFSGMLVFQADPENGIQELGRIDHHGLGENPSMRRSVYIEDAIYSISNRGIKVNDLFEPALLFAEVPLP